MSKRIAALIFSCVLIFAAGCGDNAADSGNSTSAADTAVTQAATSESAETSACATSEISSFAEETDIAEPETVIEATVEISVEDTAETYEIFAITEESTVQSAEPESESAEAVDSQEAVAAEPHLGLYQADTMECLYQQNADEQIYPASLTKVLTACTALKYASPDTVYTVGTELTLVQPHSSLCLIQQGHMLTLRDLLTGMLMSSGNDAAYTVAVNVAREAAENHDMSDEEAAAYFVVLMNDYAAELGAENSHFVNPEGWDNPEQHTTVHDLALISAHAMEISEIREIVSSHSKYVVFASGENITWYNTNALLNADSPYYLPNATGLKTGTTDLAGNCLIAAAEADGTEYIAIVANCATNDERYEKIHELFNMTNGEL